MPKGVGVRVPERPMGGDKLGTKVPMKPQRGIDATAMQDASIYGFGWEVRRDINVTSSRMQR